MEKWTKKGVQRDFVRNNLRILKSLRVLNILKVLRILMILRILRITSHM